MVTFRIISYKNNESLALKKLTETWCKGLLRVCMSENCFALLIVGNSIWQMTQVK